MLKPTVIPYPADVPAAIISPNMVQLAFQPPHRLIFAWGRANCMSDELWETTIASDNTAVAPEQVVSALLPPWGSSQLQGSSEVGDAGGYDLTWIKCSARVVLGNVPASASFDTPLDYTKLGHAWLDIDPGSSTR